MGDNNNRNSIPRFCQNHLKIHTCEYTQLSTIVKTMESDIGAKVRRLMGTQTEEELAVEAAKMNKQPEKGSISYILAQAKQKIAENKKNREQEEIDIQAKAVTQEEVSDRMAALRAKMNGGNESDINPVKTKNIAKTPSKAKKIENVTPIQNNESFFDVDLDNVDNLKKELSDSSNNSPKEVTKNKKNSGTVAKAKDDSISKRNNIAKKSSKTTSAASAVTRKKPSAKLDKPVFTAEETKELIEEAVKKALKDVGIIKK